MDRDNLLAAIEELRRSGEKAKAEVNILLGESVVLYRQEVQAAVAEGTARLRQLVAEASGNNPFCTDLLAKTSSYLDWLQWTLWDLPVFAAVTRPDPAQFRERLSATSLIYFGGRILDDFFDRHYLYRGRRATLLAELRKITGNETENVVVMIALLVILEGVSNLGALYSGALLSIKRVLVGVLMENCPPDTRDEAYYQRLIGLKNVDYFEGLYLALDPGREWQLFPALCLYYALAQKLNDVQDYQRDSAQQRPNLVVISGPIAAEEAIGQDILELAKEAELLQALPSLVLLTKLAETIEDASAAGLFHPEPAAAKPGNEPLIGITWQSDYGEFPARGGGLFLMDDACPVCCATSGRVLFLKQGFRYCQCESCDHVYVSPRLDVALCARLRDQLGDIPVRRQDGERLFAEEWVRLLRSHTEGTRLLDVRMDPGILPRAARAAGFQTYGLGDENRLRRLFGERVCRVDPETEEIPWGDFDAITLLHVLDRFSRPELALQAFAKALTPSGVLLVTVPDSESLQFRIFGKRWDALNPLACAHFFCERSLFRLLRDAGLEPILRANAPTLPHESRTRWMRLLRSLGGDETGDLVVLARPAFRTPDADSLD
jgi:SAM-dependent methyltransferase